MDRALASRLPRLAARGAIRAYQLTLSGLVGRHCRHLPSCSDYADEAIARHGLWAGGWMGLARICRCGPGGTSGLDFVCEELPHAARWYAPWRYGRWSGVNASAALPEMDGDAPARAGDPREMPVQNVARMLK